jgi:putative tryptophan/tyrosine transport system substrate-binding protein
MAGHRVRKSSAHSHRSSYASGTQIVGKTLREFIELAEAAGDSSALGFFKELDRLGYGQSLLIEAYSGQGRVSHYAELAREVVSRNPDLIIPLSTELTLVFKAATITIPIVGSFAIPVESGIVANLARPGGNITGVAADVGPEQWGKRVQLLQQVVPQATRLAVLHSRAVREQYGPKEQSQWMGATWVGPPFDQPVDEAEYRRVFTGLVQDHAEGIVVVDETSNLDNQKLIVELAEKSRLPAIYPYKMFVQAGGLMSYGIDTRDHGSSLADMVGEVLKGAKPSEIPIRQPTKFEEAYPMSPGDFHGECVVLAGFVGIDGSGLMAAVGPNAKCRNVRFCAAVRV